MEASPAYLCSYHRIAPPSDGGMRSGCVWHPWPGNEIQVDTTVGLPADRSAQRLQRGCSSVRLMKSICLGMALPTWRPKEAEMKKLVSTLGAFAVVLIGVPVFALAAAPVGPAGADPTYAPLCGSNEATAGTALSGNYKNLVVSGIAYVNTGATLNVSGNLTLAPGACLDAFSLGAVHVGQNVTVLPKATLALGCAPGSNGPPPIPPCGFGVADDTVGGNITADQPLTMYLTAVTVGGNVVSIGGGFSTPGLSFPVKNMNIRGNLVLQGWRGGPGAWIGALRNNVGGNVIISNNVGSRPGDDGSNDSTEVDGNSVRGNLICLNNTPPAEYGDAYGEAPGNGPNVVGRLALGECASLTTPLTTSD